MNVDLIRLAAVLSERFHQGLRELVPLGIPCTWPVFRAVADGGREMFVKVTEKATAERTLTCLGSAGDCPLLPRPVIPETLDFGEYAVLCLDWRETRRVEPERMTDAQFLSFVEGLRCLAEALKSYSGPFSDFAEEDRPESYYDALVRYAARHPLAGRLLKPLLALPERMRSYAGWEPVPIHGDFQARNYGFDGDRLVAVFDVDDIVPGLPCEDATYAFTERLRHSELTAAGRERIVSLFLRMVGMLPWSLADWQFAVSHARLRIAARRLLRHPRSPFIAFDVLRRDRPLRLLAEALETYHA